MSTKNFRRRRRGFSMRSGIIVAVFALVVAAVLLWRPVFQGLLGRSVAPAQKTKAAVSTDLTGVFSSKIALAQENAELKKELASLQARVADRDALKQQNDALKAELNRSDIAGSSVAAGVLLAPPATPYDRLLIDAGAGQGITAGDLVSAGEGAFIGVISDVGPRSSSVELFSSPNERHQGLLNGTVPITIEGAGEGALSGEVPASTPVVVGDSVSIPGLAGGVSELVASIDAPSGDSFKTLYFHLPVNVSELQLVEVRLNSSPASEVLP